MPKITKAESARHDQAERLLQLDRPLTHDEIELIYTHWTPMAASNVTKNAAFFTPDDLAHELNLWSAEEGHLLDLGAGIGMLAWKAQELAEWPSKKLDITCLELNPEYVAIGRKLLPEATWICGDMFNLQTLRSLELPGGYDCVISNPPFGRVPTGAAPGWLAYRGPAHLMAVEVAIRLGQRAIMILPSSDMPWSDRSTHGHEDKVRGCTTTLAWRRFNALYPWLQWGSCSCDTRAYSFDGADPAVELVELEVDGGEDSEHHLPIGLPKGE